MSADKYKRASPEQLADEAREWMSEQRAPSRWEDAPERVPKSAQSTAISVRLPKDMLRILREFARREGIGYQVLMKRWLDDRIRAEYRRIRKPARRPLEGVVTLRPTAVLQNVSVLSRKAQIEVVAQPVSFGSHASDPVEES